MCMTQVVCAGVWHNGLLCLACWLSALLLPMLLLPLYSTGQGAVVWWVTQQLHGKLVPSWLHDIMSDRTCLFLPGMLLWRASDLDLCSRAVHQVCATALSTAQPPAARRHDHRCQWMRSPQHRYPAGVHRCTGSSPFRAQPSVRKCACKRSTCPADVDLPCKQALDRIACRMRRSSSTRRQQNSRCELPSRSLATA